MCGERATTVLRGLANGVRSMLPAISLNRCGSGLTLLRDGVGVGVRHVRDGVGRPASVITLRSASSVLLSLNRVVSRVGHRVVAGGDVIGSGQGGRRRYEHRI